MKVKNGFKYNKNGWNYISIKGEKKTKAPQLRGLKSLEVFLSLYISIKGDKKKAPQLRGFSIIKVCFLNQKTILLCFRLI